MKTSRRLFAALALLACACLPVQAQIGDWPRRQPIKLVAVFPPGGSVDQVSRILAQQLTHQLGQTVIVENKVGASGVIGTHYVLSAPPDGYAYAVVFDTHGVNPSLMPSMPYDTRKDIAPVIVIGTAPMVIATPAASEYKTFAEVVAASKAKKNISFGSVGSGSLSHLAMAMLVRRGGLDMTHVPYKGGTDALMAAVNGQIPVSFAPLSAALPHVKAGKIKVLAVLDTKRYPGNPDIPAMSEQVPEYDKMPTGTFYYGPAGMQSAVVHRLYEEIKKAVTSPDVVERMRAIAFFSTVNTPEEFAAQTRREIDVAARGIKAAGLQPE
jgi:tripartite-type tricarboxylate transporter receptor subunit TctC